MMVARWRIDARFGHKAEVISLIKQWNEKFGRAVGWTGDKIQMTTGSVGVAESSIITEVKVENLAELNDAFDNIAKLDGHAAWGKEMEPHVVSGTHCWEIYRIL